MLSYLMKLRNNKKGFTLIEIIVVLVILAILAAVAIPSMLGYVNQAKGAQYITEARLFYTAGQVVATKYQLATGSADEITLQGTTSSTATSTNNNEAAKALNATTDIYSMVSKDVAVGELKADEKVNTYNYQIVIKSGKVTNTQVIAQVDTSKWIKVNITTNGEAVYTEYSKKDDAAFDDAAGTVYVNGLKKGA